MFKTPRARCPTAGPGNVNLPVESALEALMDTSYDGLLVVRDGLTVRANAAAATLLGVELASLIGAPPPVDPTSQPGDQATSPDPVGAVEVGSARNRRTVTYRVVSFDHDRHHLIVLRDVTVLQERERQLLAFTRTSSQVASHHPLEVVVDQLAEEVRQASRMAMCTIVTVDPATGTMTQAGKAGLPDDYGARLEACQANGAPLLTTRVHRTGEALVVPGYRAMMLADPRFAPLHEVVGPQDWDIFVAVPLRIRDQRLGTLTGFLERGKSLNDRQVQFVSSMANQAAVAIENCLLASQMQSKAALDERHRLARELHDTVSQSLFSLNLHARAAQIGLRRLQLEPDEPLVRDLQAVVELAHGASGMMGQLIHHLRPEALLHEGLRPALETYCRQIAVREDLPVHVHLTDGELPLAREVELSIFRLIQEAIHNAVKHASASSITVRLEEPHSAWGTVVVSVEDDGVGFDPRSVPLGQLGLATMRERAVGLGGTLTVDSPVTRTGGTRVRAVLPHVLDRAGAAHKEHRAGHWEDS